MFVVWFVENICGFLLRIQLPLKTIFFRRNMKPIWRSTIFAMENQKYSLQIIRHVIYCRVFYEALQFHMTWFGLVLTMTFWFALLSVYVLFSIKFHNVCRTRVASFRKAILFPVFKNRFSRPVSWPKIFLFGYFRHLWSCSTFVDFSIRTFNSNTSIEVFDRFVLFSTCVRFLDFGIDVLKSSIS